MLFLNRFFSVSTVTPARSYCGITNNWKRRIRQHNGIILGGAKYTQSHRPWVGFIHITGLTKKQALQLEWNIKHRVEKSQLLFYTILY